VVYHSVGTFIGAAVFGAALNGSGMPREEAAVIGAFVGFFVAHVIQDVIKSFEKRATEASYASYLARAAAEAPVATVTAGREATEPAAEAPVATVTAGRDATDATSTGQPVAHVPAARPNAAYDAPKPASDRESARWADY
jgi:hypothetical protein